MKTSIPSLVSCTLLFMTLGTTAVLADESMIVLKPGTGLDLVEGYCAACHSLDFIQMNAPIQDEKGWTETVGKMVHVMGATITEDEQKKIVAYLSANYGK